MALKRKESDLNDDLEGFDDFTIASPWERFIAKVEEILREWQTVSVSALADSGTEVEGALGLYKVHQELPYGSKNYGIDFYFQVNNEKRSRGEWGDGLHPLQLCFGIVDFLVVSPMSMSGVVLDAPEATLLLSTMAVALSNCGSDLAAFVPVHVPTRKAYYGIRGTKAFSVRYETDRLGSRIPDEFMHLEGLYNFFNSKVDFRIGASDLPLSDVEFTMQLTYRTPMPGFKYRESNAEPISNYDGDLFEELAWDEECAWAEWHSVEDPVKGYELICYWNQRSLKNATEATNYEKLSPTEADKWALTIVKVKDQAGTNEIESVGFAGRLRALIDALHVSSQAHFVEDFAADSSNVKHVTHHHIVPPPTVLERVIKDLFEEETSEEHRGHINHKAIKAAPPDSLISRFCLHALRFGTCNIRAIAVLWMDFVREVRWCWDEGFRLPRVSVDGSPDLESCLLHQKLQMLALCIEEKALQRGVIEDLQEDHGFQDLAVYGTDEAAAEMVTEDMDVERKGSAGPVGNLMLLEAKRSLHAPLTQKLPILTEDMLEEREQTLTTLQNLDELIRIRHERNVLASDMAAFKAANPGAVLEDFMQWYLCERELHPGDFGEEYISEQDQAAENGKALKTMSRPDNVEIWESVDACAACDQKPLFDYTREAEKVLHYLETIRPHFLLAQMLACSFAVAAHSLDRSVINFRVATLTWELEELSTSMESVFPSLEDTVKRGTGIAADWQRKLLQLYGVFQRVEGNVILAASLGKKFSRVPRLLAALINHHLEPHKVPVARVLVEKGLASNRWKDSESLDERQAVATVFTPESTNASWRQGPSLGHLLNGHEPISRETPHILGVIDRSCILEHDSMVYVTEVRNFAMEPAAKRGRKDSNLKDKDARLEPKPYFVTLTAKSLDGVLFYDTSTQKLSFKRLRFPVNHPLSSFGVEGLIFCRHQGVFNIHNRTWHVVPQAPEESKHRPAIGMIVDTNARPYTFKLVMGSVDKKTQIYDSKTRSWSTRASKVMQVAKSALNSPKPVTCVCSKGCIYISIDISILLVYSTEGDKWKILNSPKVKQKKNGGCALGAWNGKVFTTRDDFEEKKLTLWELVDQEWAEYAIMPKEHYNMVCGSQKNEVCLLPRFCDGHLLIYNSHCFSASVVLDLASKKWKQVALGAEEDEQGEGSGDEGEGSGDEGEGSGDEGEGSGDEGEGSGDEGEGSGDEGEGSEGESEGGSEDEGGSADESEEKEGGSDDGEDEVDNGEGFEGEEDEGEDDDNEGENGEGSDDNEEEEDSVDNSEDEDEE